VILLLDTCTLLWLTQEPDRLSACSRAAIDEADNELVVSHATIWELALKTLAGKLSFSPPLRRWLAEQKGIWRFGYLAITEEQILRTLEIERHHLDPFDRLLVAQALDRNLPIITPDPFISRYPIQVLW
jgi:PIN domain nuclease of toxin-antitoxin system